MQTDVSPIVLELLSSPHLVEGLQIRPLLHNLTQSRSQSWVNPLFRQITETGSPIYTIPGRPTSKKPTPFASSSSSLAYENFEGSQRHTTQTKKILTPVTNMQPALCCLGTSDRMSGYSIHTRELPPLHPSLVPHGSRKPFRPTHIAVDGITEKNHVNSLGHGSVLPIASAVSKTDWEQEGRSSSLKRVEVDAYARHAYPTMNETGHYTPALSPASGSRPRFTFSTSHFVPSNPKSAVASETSRGYCDGALPLWTRNLLSCVPRDCNDEVQELRHKSLSYVSRGCSSTPQANDYPLRYSDVPAKDGGPPENRRGVEKGKDQSDDDWQGGDYGGGEGEYGGGNSDGGGGGDDNNRARKEPPKKRTSKKTELACKFCRGRKLKCDGCRPACYNCSRRSQPCIYDEEIRRRGPGRKNRTSLMHPQELDRGKQCEASTSTLVSASSSMYGSLLPPPLYNAPSSLPGPPVPQYNYDVGRIQSTNVGPGVGPRAASAAPSATRGQETYRGHERYPPTLQYTGHSQPGEYIQEQPQEQYYGQAVAQQPPRAEAHQGFTYGQEYGQVYPSRMRNLSYRGGPSTEGEELEYPSEEGDDEGTSGSLSKRRASSPPEDSSLSSHQRRRYDYDRGAGP